MNRKFEIPWFMITLSLCFSYVTVRGVRRIVFVRAPHLAFLVVFIFFILHAKLLFNVLQLVYALLSENFCFRSWKRLILVLLYSHVNKQHNKCGLYRYEQK